VAAEALASARSNAGAQIRSQGLASSRRNAEIENATAETSTNYAGRLKRKVDDLLVENGRGISKGQREGFNDAELANLDSFIRSGKVGKGAAEWLREAPMGFGNWFAKAIQSGQGAVANRALEALDEGVRQRSALFMQRVGALPPDVARVIMNVVRNGQAPNQAEWAEIIRTLRPAAGAIPNQ
jgi:hypothetical protein